MLYIIVLKAREDTKSKINEECYKLYFNKLEAYNIISNKENIETKNYKFKLIYNKEDQEKYLGDIYTYVPIFLNSLWAIAYPTQHFKKKFPKPKDWCILYGAEIIKTLFQYLKNQKRQC